MNVLFSTLRPPLFCCRLLPVSATVQKLLLKPKITRSTRRLLSATTTTTPLFEALCDVHDAKSVALRYSNSSSDNDELQMLTYGMLSDRSKRLAHALKEAAHVKPNDVVAVMLPKGPAQMECAVALTRLGAIYQPLFTAFQSEGIRQRIGTKDTTASAAKVVITDDVNLHKVQQVDSVECIIIIGGDNYASDNGRHHSGTTTLLNYEEIITNFDSLQDRHHYYPPGGDGGDQPMALLYSSGTTGPPKGVVCPAKALEAFRIYLEQGIGLQPEDNYWNIADAGWAYGLYYNVYGPLVLGQTAHMLNSPFTPESTLQFMAKNSITSFAAAPTVFWGLRSMNPSVLEEYAPIICKSLRAACSAGEPISPAISDFFQRNFGGVMILNHYGQTENGMMINQHRAGKYSCTAAAVPSSKKGGSSSSSSISCGVHMEGFEGACLLDNQGNLIEEPNIEGELCMKVQDCPLFWFMGYYKANKPFMDSNGYYHTGDRALFQIMEDTGERHYIFSSRNDDVITTSGYRVGPAEIEGSILQLDWVSEVAVVGVPDPDEKRGEAIQAYVVIQPNHHNVVDQQDDDMKHTLTLLEKEIKSHIKQNLAKHLAPQIVSFVPSLPKTDSGKIKRFLLRQGVLE